jgi:hypothetical protein
VGDVYIDGGAVRIVSSTIRGNHATTSEDDVFGPFTP